MISYLDEKLKLLFETAVICENEYKIRNLCSEIIAGAQEENNGEAISQCRKKLRKLENEKYRNEVTGEFREFDIAKLIENLSLCCDILLSDIGKSVNCHAERNLVSCRPATIIDAFMNLISNSAKFTEDGFIDVTVKTEPGYTLITTQNSGSIDFSKIGHGGIEAAANIAQSHGGRLFYAEKNGMVEAAFCIPRRETTEKRFDVPDCTAFLTDEFSAVHIGLSDVFV